MTQPDAYDGYRSLFDDPNQAFRNEVCGRIALTLGTYMPARSAGDLGCPLLVTALTDDSITPVGPARAMAERAPQGEFVEYGGVGHFDIYTGDLFDRAVTDHTDFLARVLLPEPAATTS